jgi:hypothetical protein
MKTWIIIAIYWVVSLVAVYAYRAYKNRKDRPLNTVLKGFGVTKDIPVWKKNVSHAVTILLVPPLLPIGLLVLLIDRIKKRIKNKKLNKIFEELIIIKERNLTKDLYYKASVALVNALAYGNFEKFEKLLDDDVQIIQVGHKTTKGKEAAMKFLRIWKIKHVDTIDLDHFYRIFDESDFEIVRSKDDSHTCVNLMMTRDTVRFEIKDGRVLKLLLTHIAEKPVDYGTDTPSTELHEWPY